MGMSRWESEARELTKAHGTFMRRATHGELWRFPTGATVMIYQKGRESTDHRAWKNALCEIKRALGMTSSSGPVEPDVKEEFMETQTDLVALGIHVQTKTKVIEERTTEAVLPLHALAALVGVEVGDEFELVDADGGFVACPVTLRISSVVERMAE